MARDTISVSSFSTSSAVASDASGTSVGPTNDGFVSGYPLEEVILRVTTSADTTATIKAGTNPPALRAGKGDYATSISSGSTSWLGPFESARFEQGDNLLHVDVSATATVSAFHVPRNIEG